MFAYYDGSGPEEIFKQIKKLHELRRDAAARAVSGDRAMIEALAREALRPDGVRDHVGVELLQDRASRNSASFDAFFHGICPGGRCNEGGKKIAAGKFEAVWRERACGACRFRVTGPRFLAGMVDRADLLMVEIQMSKERDDTLSTQYQQESDLLVKLQIQSEIRAEQKLQLNLQNEWQIGHNMIQLCRAVKLVPVGDDELPDKVLVVRSQADPGQFTFIPTETHALVVVQKILKQSRQDPDLAFRLPKDLEDFRKRILRLFTKEADIQKLLYKIPPENVPAAMDNLGDTLIGFSQSSQDLQDILENEFSQKRDTIINATKRILQKVLVEIENGRSDDQGKLP
jgi:hypothetical protein